jgi:hypothetical protein
MGMFLIFLQTTAIVEQYTFHKNSEILFKDLVRGKKFLALRAKSGVLFKGHVFFFAPVD